MKLYYGALRVFLVVPLMTLYWPSALAVDTSIASLTISAFVPTQVSLTTQSLASEINLTPGTSTENKMLSVLHFKYNHPLSQVTISSDSVSGQPEDERGNPFSLQGLGLNLSVNPGCKSIDSNYNFPFTINSEGKDIKSETAAHPQEGVEEDCVISASWVGTPKKAPMAGRYTLTVKFVVMAD